MRTDPQMTAEAKEQLGCAIDRVDGVAHSILMKAPDEFHVKMVRSLLPEIVRDLKKHYAELTGENPWEGHPS